MTIDSHAGAQERGAKGAEPGGPESAGSGRDGLINSDGWDLLVEAAARFREYEGHHRQRVAEFAEKAACAAGWRAEEWRRDEAAALAKADRNGDMAARIEGWLIVNDPEMQRLGEIWRNGPAEPARWGGDVHPVDALKGWALSIGLDLDPAWEARARAHCDEMVEVYGVCEERPDDAHPGVSIGQVHDIVPGSILLDGQQPPAGAIVERHPAAEGLEAYHHRPDCECALCWPVVHVTGGLPGGAK